MAADWTKQDELDAFDRTIAGVEKKDGSGGVDVIYSRNQFIADIVGDEMVDEMRATILRVLRKHREIIAGRE